MTRLATESSIWYGGGGGGQILYDELCNYVVSNIEAHSQFVSNLKH